MIFDELGKYPLLIKGGFFLFLFHKSYFFLNVFPACIEIILSFNPFNKFQNSELTFYLLVFPSLFNL